MSSYSIDYIVYCQSWVENTTFVAASDRLWRRPVILFLQKTWFMWWILATLVILRWFHLFSSCADDEGAFEAADSVKEEVSTGSKHVPSGTTSRLSA
jgi:hypothetical protein